MSKSIGVRLDDHQVDHLKEMVENGQAESISEAMRKEIGFGTTDTALRQTARRFGDAFAIVALMMFGGTFFLPLEFRMFVVAPFLAALSCYSLDRTLKNFEPAVSNRITRVFTREKA